MAVWFQILHFATALNYLSLSPLPELRHWHIKWVSQSLMGGPEARFFSIESHCLFQALPLDSAFSIRYMSYTREGQDFTARQSLDFFFCKKRIVTIPYQGCCEDKENQERLTHLRVRDNLQSFPSLPPSSLSPHSAVLQAASLFRSPHSVLGS